MGGVNMENKHEILTQRWSSWGDKLLGNAKSLAILQDEKRFVPQNIQIGPVEMCDSDCPFCSVAGRPLKSYIRFEKIEKMLRDFKDLGAKALELSTDEREQITIKRPNGFFPERITIGEYVNSLLGEKEKESEFRSIDTGDRVLSVNEKGDVSYKKITGVLRYRRTTPAYKITIDGGLSIIVSENHSICKYDSKTDTFIKIKPTELEIKEDWIPRYEFQDWGTEDYIVLETKKYKTSNRGFVQEFPNTIIIDEQFARFLGLFIAEGNVSHYNVTFTFNKNELEYIEYVQKMFSYLNVNSFLVKRESTTQVIGSSLVLSSLLSDLKYLVPGEEVPSRRKRIPNVIFQSSQSVKYAFLEGLLEGDGYTEDRISCGSDISSKQLKTASRTLADDTLVLVQMLGGQARIEWGINKERICEGRILEESDFHRVVIKDNENKLSSWNIRTPIKKKISNPKKQRQWKNIYECTEKDSKTIYSSIRNGIRFGRVTKIEQTNEASEWFYDLEVEDTKTFFSANGILAWDTGAGNPMIYRDKNYSPAKTISDIVEVAGKLNYDIGIITNSHKFKPFLRKDVYDYITWIRVSMIKIDEGAEPEDYDFNGFPEERIGTSYIIYDPIYDNEGNLIADSLSRTGRVYKGTTAESIEKIARLIELHPKIKFVRYAGNCLIKGNNLEVRERYKGIIDALDKYQKFFIKDIGENDSAFNDGCYVGAYRPYIVSHPHEPDNPQVYICSSHVLNTRTYSMEYSLGSIDDIPAIWARMNENFQKYGYPYEVKGNQGCNWETSCKFCYYYNNNSLLHTIAQAEHMPDRSFV